MWIGCRAAFLNQEQARVTAGDDQGNGREVCLLDRVPCEACHFVFEQNGVDVTLEVVHAHQRFSQREGKGFAIHQADQERPHQAWSLCYATPSTSRIPTRARWQASS